MRFEAMLGKQMHVYLLFYLNQNGIIREMMNGSRTIEMEKMMRRKVVNMIILPKQVTSVVLDLKIPTKMRKQAVFSTHEK